MSALSWEWLHWTKLLPSSELSFLWDLKNQQLWNWLLTDFNWDGPKLKISKIKSLGAYSPSWCVNFFIAFTVCLFFPDIQRTCSLLWSSTSDILELYWSSETFWPHYIWHYIKISFSSHLNSALFTYLFLSACLEVSYPKKKFFKYLTTQKI